MSTVQDPTDLTDIRMYASGVTDGPLSLEAGVQILTEQGINVVQTAGGGDYSLALTDNGDVYSFGRGGDGRLGHGNTVGQSLPVRIGDLNDVGVVDPQLVALYDGALAGLSTLAGWDTSA